MSNFKQSLHKYVLLFRNIPSMVMALFLVSVVLMNFLANKEINTGIPWLALDCGLVLSWLSFLCMDMITKRFGAKASIQVSLTTMVVNLLFCGALFIISKFPGNWGEFYTFEDEMVNSALNHTVGGTWFVVLGSATAFAVSSIVNALINAGIGKLEKKNTFGSFAIRSYVSTIVAQFVDNMVFALLVSHHFFGWSLIQCVTCSLTGCVVELICEVVFSPIGYRACKKWEAENVGKEYLNYENESYKE